ncbi:M56 family metallopeptidase [bacterium]|nr:M56 family metallopeptidase [bacterium]
MTLATMCFQGSVMIVLVLLARAVLRARIPSLAFYVMWLFVIARLLMPVALPVENGVWSAARGFVTAAIDAACQSSPLAAHVEVGDAGAGANMVPGDATVPAGGRHGDSAGIGDTRISETHAASSEAASTALTDDRLASKADSSSLATVLNRVRLVGTICAAAFASVLYVVVCANALRTSCPMDDTRAKKLLTSTWHAGRRRVRLRVSATARTPFTFGIVRPVIVVPTGLLTRDASTNGLASILRHEIVHVRRLDVLVKALLVAAICLYWYDPLVWAMFIACSHDIERSCDEVVARKLDLSGRRAYALAILDVAYAGMRAHRLCDHGLTVATSFASGGPLGTKSELSTRVEGIMRGSTWSRPSRIVAGVLVGAMALACGTTSGAASGTGTADVNGQVGDANALSARMSAGMDEDVAGDVDAGAATQDTFSLPTSSEEIAGLGALKPTAQPHSDTSLVSELVADDGSIALVTPFYTLVLPEGLTKGQMSWEYDGSTTGRVSGSRVPAFGGTLPADAFGTTVVRNAVTQDVIAIAFCQHRNGYNERASVWDATEAVMPECSVVATASDRDPDSGDLIDAVVIVSADDHGNGVTSARDASEMPYFTGCGSLGKVYGLAQGQASREAFIACASRESDGVRIDARGYSVLIPDSMRDADKATMGSFACAYYAATDDPQVTDEMVVSVGDLIFITEVVTSDKTVDTNEFGSVVVGQTNGGGAVVLAVRKAGSFVDASPYASLVSVS